MIPVNPPKDLTDDFVEGLGRDLKLNEHEMQIFKQGALSAGCNWVRKSEASHSTESKRTIRVALNGLADAASKTVEQLKSAPDSVWEIISDTQEPFRCSGYEDYVEVAEKYLYSKAPEKSETSIVLGDPFDFETRISISDLGRALEVIAHFSNAAAKLTLEPKRGPQPDWPLEAWIRDMASVWEGKLGKRFTRDVTSDGEPVSLAARMLVALYEKMDPKTPSSRVLNEMKKLIVTRGQTQRWKK